MLDWPVSGRSGSAATTRRHGGLGADGPPDLSRDGHGTARQRRRSLMGALVTYRLHDSVATITMDDGKVNVLSLAMLTELNAALDRAAADRAVVVLTGRDGVFSAGFDLP